MQRKAGVPVVFISSTSEDLKPYRDAARDAAIRAGFYPDMMEYFTAGGKRRPLGECLAKVSASDVVVVLVAHRYGWKPSEPPGDGSKSVTRLECEQAAIQGKEVLAFLVDEDYPWPPKLVQQDKGRLQKFKRWLGDRRFHERFTTPDDLRGKVEGALREWRDLRQRPAAQVETRSARAEEPDLTRYLHWLREENAWIDIRGLQVGTGKAYRFPIEDLYIPLRITGEAGKRGERAPGEPSRLEDALEHPRLTIAGDPGTGKTTFLNHLAFQMSSSLQSGTEGPLPVLIRIAELAEHIQTSRKRHEGPTIAHEPGWLAHFLATQSIQFGLDVAFFEAKLRNGEAAVLLDGLDEAPSREERESIARLLENGERAYAQCRFVVTTRPLAYQGLAVLDGFAKAVIAPLDPEAIETFLNHWCRGLFPERPEAAARHFADLSAAMRAVGEIRLMARNPLMLTALAVVHWNERRLPEQRADLYDSILTWMARSHEHKPGRTKADRCLKLLQQLALAMQNAPKGRLKQIGKGQAADALAAQFAEGAKADQRQRAQEFLEDEEIDSGIIVSRANEIAFRHLTFQEYLAAKAIGGMEEKPQRSLLLAGDTIYQPEWREVALLLGGVLYGQGMAKVDGLVSAMLARLTQRSSLARRARCAGLLALPPHS